MKSALADCRVAAGYTQEQVAEKLGISVAAYCQYETGKRRIPSEIVDEIVKMLRIKNRKGDIFVPVCLTVRKN